MSTYPTDDSVHPTTPLFDETAVSTSVYVDTTDEDLDGGSKADQAKAAAGQAKDTVKDTAGQAADTVKDTAGHAKEQAKQVGGVAADAAQSVAATTKEQAGRVASDAIGQARELYSQATGELSSQAAKQQKTAASTLRTFGDDLSAMHAQGQGGLAAELVQNLSQRATGVADWLESREPGDVFDEVKQFAARRPGLFILLAGVTGALAARATKALVAEAKPDHIDPTPSRSTYTPASGPVDDGYSTDRYAGATTGYGTEPAYGTEPTYGAEPTYGTEPALGTTDPYADPAAPGSSRYGDAR